MPRLDPPVRAIARAPAADEPARPREPELLLFGTPREVLARIVPEDSLGLRARLRRKLVERALVFDLERLLLRAQALCARRAPAWRGAPELESWLEARVEEALACVLAERQRARGEAVEVPGSERGRAALGIEPASLERACARFNRLPLEQRSAFIALVLEGAEPDRVARRTGVSLSLLARRARAALEVFRADESLPSRAIERET